MLLIFIKHFVKASFIEGWQIQKPCHGKVNSFSTFCCWNSSTKVWGTPCRGAFRDFHPIPNPSNYSFWAFNPGYTDVFKAFSGSMWQSVALQDHLKTTRRPLGDHFFAHKQWKLMEIDLKNRNIHPCQQIRFKIITPLSPPWNFLILLVGQRKKIPST